MLRERVLPRLDRAPAPHQPARAPRPAAAPKGGPELGVSSSPSRNGEVIDAAGPSAAPTPRTAIEHIIELRVLAANRARAQFLGCAFALTFLAGAIGDAASMGTLRHHGFMLAQLVLSLAVVAVARWSRHAERHSALIFVVGMTLVSASGAAHLAQFGGLDGPHFYGVYTAAPVLIPIFLSTPARIAGTVATVGAYVLVYWSLRPDLLSHPMAHIPATYLITIGALSVLTGRYVQRLKCGNFADVARLEAAANVLDAQLRDVEAHPSRLRHEIARQLHDDVAQLITGARLQLDGWSQRRAKDDAVTRVSELLDERAGRARRMLEALRAQSALTDLEPELERLRAEYASLGLTITLVIDQEGGEVPLAASHVEVLVASTREALTNAVRHGGAREATVAATLSASRVTIEVWDDGGGKAAAVREGYGLLGIRERIASVGGTVTLDDYDAGLRLTISVPRGGS